jgi:hypothetical protein
VFFFYSRISVKKAVFLNIQKIQKFTKKHTVFALIKYPPVTGSQYALTGETFTTTESVKKDEVQIEKIQCGIARNWACGADFKTKKNLH